MKYLCLVYLDESKLEALSKDEGKVLDRESIAYDEELKRNGHYLGSNALQSIKTAVTVRVRGGKLSTTDGPFVETKEHVGGYILIEASDLNEAIRIAARIPVGRYGGIEVRPIMDLA